MESFVRAQGSRLLVGNKLIECEFDLDGRCSLLHLKELSSGRVMASQRSQLIVADRAVTDIAAPGAGSAKLLSIDDSEDAYQGRGARAKVEFVATLNGGAKLSIERQITVYDGAPAVRIVDFLSSDAPLAGLLLSDIVSLSVPAAKGSCDIYDYFSCTDQSNWRLLRKDGVSGKAQGFLALLGGVFVYREGPVPDCQPYKTDFNFVFDKAENKLSLAGLGFDRIRPGELRRANGVVLGLSLNAGTLSGLKLYQSKRYKPRPEVEGEFHSNSWPAFGLEVDEAKIDRELDLAAEAGLKTVFIDDGWFKTFMGEIDEVKFPNKFDKLHAKAKSKGLLIGLWMNPLGMDSLDSRAALWDGAECHDTNVEGNNWNWLARSDDFAPVETHFSEGSRVYYSMDLMNEGYYNHIRDKIVAFHRDYGICRFKFDLYQLSPYDTQLGDRHQHFERYRDLLSELRSRIPNLSISMDTTRRNRPNFDFGLDFGRLFMENRGRNLKDHRFYQPYVSLRNLWQESLVVPSRRLDLEVRPQEPEYSVAYTLSTAIFATPLYWGALAEMSPERLKDMAKFVKTLAPHKRAILEGLVIPFGEVPDKGSWSGMLSLGEDGRSGYVAVYRNGVAAKSWTVALPGLEDAELKMTDVFEGGTFALKGGSATFVIDEGFGFKLCSFSVCS
jgi:hypothetical protein